eukprot:6194019-Pleurochrysis_carterae.AAC.2
MKWISNNIAAARATRMWRGAMRRQEAKEESETEAPLRFHQGRHRTIPFDETPNFPKDARPICSKTTDFCFRQRHRVQISARARVIRFHERTLRPSRLLASSAEARRLFTKRATASRGSARCDARYSLIDS